MGELMKIERVIEWNLCNLFALMMILCDSDTKNLKFGRYKDDTRAVLKEKGIIEPTNA